MENLLKRQERGKGIRNKNAGTGLEEKGSRKNQKL